MIWQLAIGALLALTLVGGAVWYERSRPPSQVLALVAALAALSVAGRVAFSPVPNVVPSTDIALIAGYTLGGAPGFAVGALTGLVSNFWLGQGPFTPWQMAGWGLCGLLGAGLARLGAREIGRVPLALWCALAGFAYGALLDLHVMVTYGGEQSLDRYLALSARGVPFNVAHAAGNFLFALAAGPAMIRMIRRYRERFEFRWSPARSAAGTAAGVAAAAVLAGALAGGGSAEAARGGAPSAVEWLRSAQNADGGFGFAPDVDSSPAMTGWACLGLEAAGVHPLDLRQNGKTPISYLRSRVREISTTGDIERTILVLEAAGVDPRRFGGRDLVAGLLARRGGDGSWGGQVNPTAFGVLALAAAGRARGNGRSAAWLAGAQNADGGWGFAPGTPSDSDSTGAVLQALVAARSSSGAVRRGVAFLRTAQRPGGGFPLQGGTTSNSQSTAWAVQGLLAAGTSPRSLRAGGRTPPDYLAANQSADGHYRYSRATDQTPVWVTGQALQAVAGEPFPLAPVPRRSAAAGKKGGGAGAVPGTGGAGGAAPGTGGVGGTGPAAPGGPAPAPAPGGAKETAKPSRPPATPTPPSAPPPPAEPELKRISGEGEEEGDGDGPDPAMIASVALVALVALGGAWMLSRQSARL